MRKPLVLALGCALLILAGGAAHGDPYEEYVKRSKDFQPVKQDKAWIARAFPSWTYMPWTYQWTIGYTGETGKWAAAHGYNGAFVDHGDVALKEGVYKKLKGRCIQESYKEIRRCQQNRPFSAQSPAEFC